MNLKGLKKFLVQAKLSTYAKSGEADEKVLPDGSKQFEYKEGNFKYLDRYKGYNSFFGKEVVSFQNKPVWEMNYRGEVKKDVAAPKEVYQFLKKALQPVTIAKPFRGPSHFASGRFDYVNQVKGDINKFQGTEIIKKDDQKVYHLDYYGGLKG